MILQRSAGFVLNAARKINRFCQCTLYLKFMLDYRIGE